MSGDFSEYSDDFVGSGDDFANTGYMFNGGEQVPFSGDEDEDERETAAILAASKNKSDPLRQSLSLVSALDLAGVNDGDGRTTARVREDRERAREKERGRELKRKMLRSSNRQQEQQRKGKHDSRGSSDSMKDNQQSKSNLRSVSSLSRRSVRATDSRKEGVGRGTLSLDNCSRGNSRQGRKRSSASSSVSSSTSSSRSSSIERSRNFGSGRASSARADVKEGRGKKKPAGALQDRSGSISAPPSGRTLAKQEKRRREIARAGGHVPSHAKLKRAEAGWDNAVFDPHKEAQRGKPTIFTKFSCFSMPNVSFLNCPYTL